MFFKVIYRFAYFCLLFCIVGVQLEGVRFKRSKEDTAEKPISVSKAQKIIDERNYILRPLDVVKVIVFQEEDLSSEVRVRKDGTVNLSLVGAIKVGGETVEDAERLIKTFYKNYLVDPNITLTVLSYHARRIFIYGQVANPGPVVIPSEEQITLAQAISLAGGHTRLANLGSVKVKRTLEDGERKVFKVNVNKIIDNADADDFRLYDQDIVFVPESIF